MAYRRPNLQLEGEFEFDSLHLQDVNANGRQRQLQSQQQPAAYPNAYQFSQQQVPTTLASSSLRDAFGPNPQQSHVRPASYNVSPSAANTSGSYLHGVYGSAANPGQDLVPNPYRNNESFNFQTTAAQPLESEPFSGGYASSSVTMQDSFPQPSSSNSSHQSPYYTSQTKTETGTAHQAKRPRKNPSAEDGNPEDHDGDVKDNGKAKPARACARCKNLKVRCEAKTENDPCKRCLNGGHDCITPGKKIRRTPPKREHLISEIQSQAKEIQRLMGILDAMGNRDYSNTNSQSDHTSSSSLHSPVLSPSPTSDSFLGPDGHSNTEERNNTATIKAVEEWIAKARESFQEFGSFIGIGGAGMPKNYLVEDDWEGGDSDGDEDLVNTPEPETFGSEDDHYNVAVEDTDGDEPPHQEGRRLRHRSSASSGGTSGTASGFSRKKLAGESAILPAVASPFGLFGKLAIKNQGSRESSVEREEDKEPGIGNYNFFKPTDAPESLVQRLDKGQNQAPHILTRGIITPMEAEKLFQIYFDRMNLSVSLLDPVLYTAQRTFYRSPFLFTVICAIASRFYPERPGLYPQIMHYAQLAAGTALINGTKNVEMCQAYILLSLYPVPARKWEDQRSWLYLGLAIRTATDLNLHLPSNAKPLNENHAREMLNRTRVWLNCVNLDRSTGSQYGKPPIISGADYMANHSQDWWKSSLYNMKHFDIHICAYNAELKVLAGFIAKIYSDPDHPTGLNKEVDFEGIATATDDELKRMGDKWISTVQQTDMSDPQNCFRTGLLRLAYSYARLVVLSYGFQHAFGKNDGTDENPFLIRCLTAAKDVVNAVVNDICRPSQLHYFRHGPEAQSVFVTFASAFLVKLLQPKFASYLTSENRSEIRRLVQQVIDLLASPEVAIDDRHGPKLYSRFLRNLLSKPMARSDPTSPGSNSSAPLPRQRNRRPNSASEQAPDQPRPFEIPSSVYSLPSPATSTSLSPPPTAAALSFDNFAPVGAVDPFAPDVLIASSMDQSLEDGVDVAFFQPALPFDDAIMQSVQSLADPSGWQDISLPGFNWMTQFQQNLGLDLRSTDAAMFDHTSAYMTGI